MRIRRADRDRGDQAENRVLVTGPRHRGPEPGSGTRCRGTTRRCRPADDRGLAATELAVVAPVLIMVFVVAIFGARVVWAERQVQSASASAARAASQAQTAGAAEMQATEVVDANLADAGLTCSGGPQVSVETAQFDSGGRVTVAVSCTADVADLTLVVGPGSYTFDHSSTEVVDTLRGGG